MPRKEIDYTKSIIYKICSKDPTITATYTGSTTDFIRRKSKHKCNCNSIKYREYSYYMYRFIRDHGGWDNWQMLEIELYPCNTKAELLRQERYWLELNCSTLNKNAPMRTAEEMPALKRVRDAQYYKNNTAHIKQIKAEYRKNNAAHIKQQKANYYQNVRKPKLLAAAIPDGYATD